MQTCASRPASAATPARWHNAAQTISGIPLSHAFHAHDQIFARLLSPALWEADRAPAIPGQLFARRICAAVASPLSKTLALAGILLALATFLPVQRCDDAPPAIPSHAFQACAAKRAAWR